ncbi:VWA domain-containing protein, partial [Candidatus Dependentiae bacterium]|nr:VWA domain-containing protein [Candidatus Dependentiae bacterium]
MKFKSKIIFLFLIILFFCLNYNVYANILSIDSLSSADFPNLISMTVTVKDGSGNPITNLTKEDFCGLMENNVPQNIYVVPPNTEGSNSKVADIVFIIDNSNSMSDEQAQVKNNIISFVNGLAAAGDIDYRLGLVRFGQGTNNGQPIIEDNGNLTADSNYYKNTILNRMTVDGGTEPGFESCYKATTQINFRSNSQKIFVVITDEPSNGDITPFQTVINTLNQNSIKVYTWYQIGQGDNHYSQNSSGSLSKETGGKSFSILDPITVLINEITSSVSSQYVITYTPTNQEYDGILRNVILCYSGNTATASYTPGARPVLTLTDATQELFIGARVDNDPNVQISVYMQDIQSPYPTNVTLHYRHITAASYTSINMTNVSDSLYRVTLPTNVIQDPGVAFYFSTTDGQLSATLPKNDPSEKPFYFAVLPNVAPIILIKDVRATNPSELIYVDVECVDTTYNIASSKIFYKDARQLLYSETTAYNTSDSNYYFRFPTLTDSYKYYYYVQATDNFNLNASNGFPDAPHQISLNDVFAPPEVTLLTPNNTSETSSKNTIFSWTKVYDRESSIKNYSIEFAKDINFSNIIYSETTVDINIFPSYNFEDTIYYWRVNAVDNWNNINSGTMKWSVFFDSNPPSIASLIQPADEAKFNAVNDTIKFEWTESIDTGLGNVSCILQFSKDNFTSVWDSQTLTNTSVIISMSYFSEDTIYYWRVLSKDKINNTNSGSDTRVFYKDNYSPTKVVLIAPENNEVMKASGSDLKFEWSQSFDTGLGFDSYTIEISNNINFTNIVYTATNLKDTFLNLNVSLFDNNNSERLYWRIISYDTLLNYNTSTVNNFLNDLLPPTEIIILKPANNDTVNFKLPTLIEWTPSVDTGVGLKMYRIQIADNVGFYPVAYSYDTTNISCSSIQVLLSDFNEKDYYIRIRAYDNFDNASLGSNINKIYNDITQPVTTDNIPADWQKNNFEVVFIATDTNLTTTFYSINNSDTLTGKTFTVANDGNFNIFYYSSDLYSNTESIKTNELKIDKTAPVISSVDYYSQDADRNLNDKSPSHFTVSCISYDTLSGLANHPLAEYYIGKNLINYTNSILMETSTLGATVYRCNISETTWKTYSEDTIFIRITATDLAGNTTVYTLSEYIDKNNDTPLLTQNPPTVVMDEDTETSPFNLNNYFSDVDKNDTLVFSATNKIPDSIAITISDTGQVFLKPDTNYNGNIQVTVRSTDQIGAYTSGSFMIILNPVNDTPVLTAIPDTSILQGQQFTYSIIADDVDNDPLIYSIVSGINGLTINNNTLSFLPTNNDVGAHTVCIRVSDNQAAVFDTFVITIINVNDTPVLSKSIPTVVMNEDSETSPFNLNDYFSDIDSNNILTFSITNKTPDSIAITISDTGQAYLKPDLNYNGNIQVTVRSTDQLGEYTDGNFTIIVNPVNDTPVLTAIPDTSILQGEQFTYSIIAADVDNDPLIYSIDSGINGLTINNNTLSFLPTNNDVGAHTVCIRVSDNQAAVFDTFVITVINVNDTPVLSKSIPTVVMNEDSETSPFNLNDYFSDIDANDIINFAALIKTPDSIAITISDTGQVYLKPDLNYNGNIQVTVRAADQQGGYTDGSFIIIVNPVNDIPKAIIKYDNNKTTSNDTFIVSQPMTLSLNADLSYDVDSDNLTYLWNFGDGASSTQKNIEHTYSRSDTYFITLTVTDIHGAVDTAYLTLIIINSLPSAVFNFGNTDIMFAGEERIFDASGSTDADGSIDSYVWQISSAADSVFYGETLTYIPNFIGSDTVTLKIFDNYGYYSETSVVITIRMPNTEIYTNVTGVRPDRYFYTLAFEDLYPNVGDGDFNDFVCDYNINRILNANNEITKIIISSKALARGAGYTHKFKVKLNINGSASISINEYKPDGTKARNTVNTSGSGLLDITLFQNTAEAFKNANGSNISNPNASSMTVEGNYAEAIITLNNPTENPLASSDILPYDPYIYINNTTPENKNTNKEVHLNTIDSNYYPFALMVPTNWSWPKEGYPIDTNIAQIKSKPLSTIAYPLFQDWRLSGYNSKINWYDYPVDKNVVKNTRTQLENNRPQITSNK